LSSTLREELEALRHAPIIFNTDRRERGLPLAELRQAERGIGCHALTLLDTGETIVFDMSHIFFDGAWGASLAEIMTNEALAWGVYASNMPDMPPTNAHPKPLSFHFQPADRETIQAAPHATAEASAESQQANVQAMLGLRKLFKRRNDLISLTVNDILILYRAIHAATYQPDPKLVSALEELLRQPAGRAAARAALDVIDPAHQVNPAILIPVDASQASPRDRLYPLNFEVPLQELDLLHLHKDTADALIAYKAASGERGHLYARFDRLQRMYLATLVGFGEMVDKAKRIALAGEDTTAGVLKLMATLPAPVQRLLEQIPRRFEMLNDIIRGREVFSNVGAVVKTSSLTRFITAKDDNEQKTLAWGAITDAEGVLLLSLRDFRPHVGLLESVGRKDLAAWIAQDYLDTYARGLNAYIHDLWQITLASRETRLD
jgi:hypothetical protein